MTLPGKLRGMFERADKGARASIFRRLDFLPAWAAVAAGVVLGGLAGGLLLQVHPVAGVAAFVALLALAGALALSGEPVAIFEAEEAEEPAKPRGPYIVRPGWVALPGGTFLMGSPEDEEDRDDDEGPVHEVRVSPFEIMQRPVTRETYAETMGKDPGWPEGDADQRPVNNVNWLDAALFCNRLSAKEGLAECYRIQGKEVSWDRAADGYRLPTEAEWEYACRAGTQTRWSFGDDEAELDRYAWYGANSNNETHPVGEKEANPWQLHDMHGNVYEWCWDWFAPYPEDPQEDPAGPDRRSSFRVLRGGAFFFTPRNLRSAFRDRFGPEVRGGFIGFRCVRSPRLQP